MVGVQLLKLGDTPDASKVLYEHDATTPLTPASNLKVVTTSAAIDRLGVDFKFKTRLVLHDHDLILVGDGDPAFGDAELLTPLGWDVDTVFTHWAEHLATMNVGSDPQRVGRRQHLRHSAVPSAVVAEAAACGRTSRKWPG